MTLAGLLSCTLPLALTDGSSAWDRIDLPTERGNVPLYLPEGDTGSEPLPLIVSLHGFTGDGVSHENYFRLRNHVDERRFMLCVPDGLPNAQGDRYWNATDFCCDFFGERPDDSGYLRSLIERLIDERNVDTGSIHVVGHSNGGFMAYRMGCDHSDLVSSIASLAGATFADRSDCTPSEPVHALQIHGTADDTIDYDGNCILFVGCYPGASESVLTWADYNGCGQETTTGELLDLVGGLPGAETSRRIHQAGCEERGVAELWRIEGGSHGPGFNGNFARELVDWLLVHRRDPPITCLGDLNGDGSVEGADLSDLLGSWGGDSERHDLDGDGVVAGGDLTILLGAWGQCPG